LSQTGARSGNLLAAKRAPKINFHLAKLQQNSCEWPNRCGL